MDLYGTRLAFRIAVGFALCGGLGVPVLFIIVGHLLRWSLSYDTEMLLDLMEWHAAFRVMLWPSSMFLVVHAPGDIMGEVRNLLFVILANIGVYAVMGLGVALTVRSRIAQLAVVLVLVTAMYGLNTYWSEHVLSFLVAAILVLVFFVWFFWKLEAITAREAAVRSR